MDASTTNKTSVSEQRALQNAGFTLGGADQAVDMFTERGFGLANRIAKAFASSNAVPAQFQSWVLKKVKGEEQWIENQAAIGNCLVAIEVARAVGMSIVAVMQNADMIEGKLRWSGKFVIAAINASKRFTPLRFDLKNLGKIKAVYKEKLGWNKELSRFNFKDVEVEVENRQCVAWALPHGVPFPSGVYTLDQAKAAGLPVIESAPVTMRMVVEEGWYGKPGSKWQTEMRELMFQYRAGSFFGNVHAPDIVMGMGRTTEEAIDMTTIDVAPDGRVTGISTEEVRRPAGDPPQAEVVSQVNTTGAAEEQQAEAAGDAGAAQTAAGQAEPPLKYAEVADALAKAGTEVELEAARALIPRVEDAIQQAELNALATKRHTEITKPAPAAKTSRRGAAAAPSSVE